MSVIVVTSIGDLTIDLFVDECPFTTKNFLKLCKIKYYNGCLFHTVQKNFTAQTGDPTGTGTGGDSIFKFLYGEQARFFSDEIRPNLKHSKMGTVAMASAGKDANASQFYITLRDDLDYLDEKHTVFGEVVEGHDTLTRVNETYVDDNGRPFKNIRIKHTYVLDDPFEDPPQLAALIPDASPEGKPKEEVEDEVRLEDDWVPMDEQVAPEDLEEVIRSKEAHSRAVVLESIGDIPDADIKPPENVLFVCKLNPVTEDEDLHTIFSRFGTVTSADIIRDFKTGDSLCYAFIEFETKEACERAYFKMDNALIDDRRIHVDFSQSVSKQWNQFRRKGTQQGKGCFKCGAQDHIAKDCPGGSTLSQQYVLKDDNRQRGGEKNAGYDMVFDEDAGKNQRQEKRHREIDEDGGVKKRKFAPGGPDDDRQRSNKDRDEDRRERRDGGKRGDREPREGMESGRRGSKEGGRRDERERRDDREYGKGNIDREPREGMESSRRGSRDGGRRDDRERRDVREYGKRDDDREPREGMESDRRGSREGGRRDDKERRNDRDYEKGNGDVGRRDRGDDVGTRKKERDADRGEGRERRSALKVEADHRDEKRRDINNEHGKKHSDSDIPRSRREQENHERSSRDSRNGGADERRGRRR